MAEAEAITAALRYLSLQASESALLDVGGFVNLAGKIEENSSEEVSADKLPEFLSKQAMAFVPTDLTTDLEGQMFVMIDVPSIITIGGLMMEWGEDEIKSALEAGNLDGDLADCSNEFFNINNGAFEKTIRKLSGLSLSLKKGSVLELKDDPKVLTDLMGGQTTTFVRQAFTLGEDKGVYIYGYTHSFVGELSDAMLESTSLEEMQSQCESDAERKSFATTITPGQRPETDEQKYTVLVIDDTSIIRRMISKMVHTLGHDIIEADNARIGLLMSTTKRPDLIILDIMMPDASGIDVLKRLQSNPDTKHIPVMMCSAKGNKDDILKCIQMGAKDFIVKPFELKVLQKKIAIHLGKINSQ